MTRGRTPKNAIKVYDKDGNYLGLQFDNVLSKIEYDLRKDRRERAKLNKEKNAKKKKIK
jgi:hypothetical protein|tara:strand:+ start:732 stop:908 length:177 start_codon:yes stop_codon:yes gene_type:complete